MKHLTSHPTQQQVTTVLTQTEGRGNLEKIRVLLVDDHPMFRFGVRSLIETEDDIDVVGEAANGSEAVEMADELMPDVIIMDLVMPEMDGVEATRRVMRNHPDAVVLIFSVVDDDAVFEAMRAGAKGYLLKGASREETLRAIRAIASGEAIFSPGAAQRLLSYFNPELTRELSPFPELSTREREMLDLIARGMTNPEIADELGLSIKTVRNRVSIIFSKLQVKSRSEAIIRARKSGLGLQ